MLNSMRPSPKLFYLLSLVLIFSCNSGSGEDDGMNENNTGVIEGFYTGSFQLNISGENITVPVSLTVNMASPNRFSGDYFETNDFMACCSTNGKDGTFNFEFDPEDNSLDNFIIRVDFNIDPGNPCTGTYTGSGTLNTGGNANQMEVDMIVDDCNVASTPAVLRLTKIGELN